MSVRWVSESIRANQDREALQTVVIHPVGVKKEQVKREGKARRRLLVREGNKFRLAE